MNKIEVKFNPCTPAPPGGYNVVYRIAGSSDSYINAGNFFISPAIFYDTLNPAGTEYEGFIKSVSEDLVCNDISWVTSESGVVDNSSCGQTLMQETTTAGYKDLGYFPLNVSGVSHIDLHWDAIERPNRFSLYDNGSLLETSGWVGSAAYFGPWGPVFLSTPLNGFISFDPVAGHEYKIRIEAGPDDPAHESVLSDNFTLSINCS